MRFLLAHKEMAIMGDPRSTSSPQTVVLRAKVPQKTMHSRRTLESIPTKRRSRFVSANPSHTLVREQETRILRALSAYLTIALLELGFKKREVFDCSGGRHTPSRPDRKYAPAVKQGKQVVSFTNPHRTVILGRRRYRRRKGRG